jgi:hypothetical protein
MVKHLHSDTKVQLTPDTPGPFSVTEKEMTSRGSEINFQLRLPLSYRETNLCVLERDRHLHYTM